MEQIVYEILTGEEGIDCSVYADRASQDAATPYVVVHRQDFEPFLSLSGPINLARYSIVLDVWGKTFSDVQSILGAVKGLLHGYSGSGCQGCFMQDSSTIEEDKYFHGQVTLFMYGA